MESHASPPKASLALAACLAAFCGVYASAGIAVRPSLYPDPAYGLLVYKSMLAGGAWNHITQPGEDNIAQDHSDFNAAWSPGQYAVPAALVDLGLPLGRALSVVCIVGSCVGIAGWLLLFRVLGVDWNVALVSALIIAASRSFNISFLIYTGGDLLAFAVFPYLASATYQLRDSRNIALATPAFMIIGFFFKNTMMIYLGAWISVLSCLRLAKQPRESRAVASAGVTLLSVAVSMALLQWGYNSRGWTAVSSYAPRPTAATLLLPAAMPLLSATSLDDVFSRLLMHPGHVAYDYKHSIPLLLSAIALSIILVWYGIRDQPRRDALVQSILFASGLAMVFAFLLSMAPETHLELSRHHRIAGYVLLPLVVQGIRHVPSPILRRGLAVMLVAPAVYGVLSFGSNWKRTYSQRLAHSKDLQITHYQLTPRLLEYLKTLDRCLPAADALVVTPSPTYALEFSRTRTLATSASGAAVERLAATQRKGIVGNLVVMVELAGMSESSTSAWLASFDSYSADQWDYFELDGHRFYVPRNQTVNRAWLISTFARIDRAETGLSELAAFVDRVSRFRAYDSEGGGESGRTSPLGQPV